MRGIPIAPASLAGKTTAQLRSLYRRLQRNYENCPVTTPRKVKIGAELDAVLDELMTRGRHKSASR